ncbi:MAG: hypothetical protein B7Z80_08405 [Rhodospirillales bacterium 20-64-7]|nr:MAG: hypothetical protein B7Z80_08405 [Rhodospirillales bacterium 20-64-7]HQT77084.1 hypothetical protein [Rhodopila sp.]
MPRLSPFALLGAVALSACSAPPPLTGQAQADADTRIACERRAEQIYNQQNRGDIYSTGSQANMPYSANYPGELTSMGLSQQYARDRIVRDCIRNKGTEPLPTPKPAPN